jgi:hypothetical protein
MRAASLPGTGEQRSLRAQPARVYRVMRGRPRDRLGAGATL